MFGIIVVLEHESCAILQFSHRVPQNFLQDFFVFCCIDFTLKKTTRVIHLLFASLSVNSVSTFLFAPRGPQMFPCLTYLERNVRVDCEFPATYQVPGPYCEYRQDSRLVGSTYPNAVIYVSTEDRRRSNVSLVTPNLCRLTWAPLADEKPFTYTCRVYQGNSWKENSMAVHHSEFTSFGSLFPPYTNSNNV